MKLRKIISLILACAMLLCFAGCVDDEDDVRGRVEHFEGTEPGNKPDGGSEDDRNGKPEDRETVEPEASGYFKDVWRGDIAFGDMEYEHYEAEWFGEYTAPIYRIAEKGGTAEEFEDADFYLTDELYYVYTMMELADLRQSADPQDSRWTEELLYSQELYYKLNDEYWAAMHAVAVSPHAELMEESYSDTLIEWFESYEPGDGGENLERYNEENALVREYYALMAEDEPDLDAIGDIYLRLVELRKAEAELYGYESYADYAYDYTYCKDYTPEDAQAVWEGVKEYFVPLMQSRGGDIMDGTEMLMSSGAVDCSSRAVLAAMDRALPGISPELHRAFEYMTDYGLYDIEHDPAKANTGYTITLYYLNEPFIFNAAYDEFYDYTDMFHEFGHFANAFYNQSDLLFGVADNDLCELQSQGMEMLFTGCYEDIFGDYASEALGYVLMNMVYSVVDGALYDEFQQRVYAEPEPDIGRVNEIYAQLYAEYGYEPYEGYESEWMGISHNFDYPFYYISYCVSALGALEIYDLMQESPAEAVDRYLEICAMDPEAYYYSEALAEAGLADIFSMDSYRDITETLAAGLGG